MSCNKRLNRTVFASLVGVYIFIPQTVSAGFFDTVMDKVERSVDKRVEKRTNKAVEDSLDKVEQGFDDTMEGKNTQKTTQEKSAKPTSDDSKSIASNPKVSWSKFDFVPGDTIIFEDAPSADEENGEFPSRWDLKEGNVEIATVDGENVIMFLTHSDIVPYIKNAKKDYLPDVFTLEFDAYFSPKCYSGRYWVSFYDRKNQRYGENKELEIYVNSLSIGDFSNEYPGKKSNWDSVGGWRHISVAFTKGKLKAYMNDTRLINIPHYSANPTGITIRAERYDKYQKFIKNIRLAKGGVKYYDRVLQDGKIIVNGIRFDVNKATLKPESSGPINEIFSLMQKHPEVKFRIEGHTDSDGDEANNLTLSQKRSEAVMQRLISMGISSDRLEAKGKGETSPIDNNATPEGKANNRRVEFIKI
ncbi:OmpA family protein [Sulfurimonas sp.]|uniref:OmpA family protein n=1 Tax=Sulfurimonas sp. TaxID=2022749 RepID=UPI003D10F2F9